MLLSWYCLPDVQHQADFYLRTACPKDHVLKTQACCDHGYHHTWKGMFEPVTLRKQEPISWGFLGHAVCLCHQVCLEHGSLAYVNSCVMAAVLWR